jgi:hypothetical protein
MTVTDDLPSPLFITPLGMLGDKRLDFGIDGGLQHPLRSLSNQFVQCATTFELRTKRQHLGIGMVSVVQILGRIHWK